MRGDRQSSRVFPESLEGPIMKEKEKEWIENTGRQSMKEGPLLKLQKPKGSMQGLGRRDIVCQWKAHTANTDMGRLEVKA